MASEDLDLENAAKENLPLTPEGMAAEWAAMPDIAPDESEPEAHIDRLMTQDEIDTMLGFSAGEDGKGGRNGIQAIVDSGSVTYERLPMLEIIFERLVRLLSTSLRNLFSDNVEVTLEGIRSVRFGDYINSISLPAMLAVFKAEEWDNFGLVTIESALTYSVLDTMLGGKRGQAAARVDGRPFTSIEMSLLRRVIGVVLGDAEAAFRPLSPVTFKVDRIESNPRFVSISRPANAAIRVELRFDMEGRGGSLHVLLPYATIEPIRELLLESFMGEKLGRDPIWENHLATEVWQADVAVKCVLHECTMPLKRVMKLEIGDTLMFDARPESVASLRCGEFIVSEGRIGRVDDKIAVQVVSPLRRSKTTMAAFDTSHLTPTA
ncbi:MULTISPECIES: flagellar motor switch protein FliM [Bosea]|jgi:flagellar motor switch protein FliM|uniref:Flagellar motor switch protein FliM n=1 Tax=Bosea rubneri TaxID=3075434 RepID=A0ABU3S377_9HYPH|nr:MULTISPECIES: flagellar motor switch protein FliM [unclassified Bosea (in: a-proteobacteria)]MDU0339197.1 flagellar motor switch protein FliM [Bosea sp. ZW T0_25]HEV7335962.1 flagellar motor switch protein FliM [Bosea sp. (in: a-proteobacteria)]